MGLNRTRVLGWTVSDLAFVLAAGFIIADTLTGREGRLAPKPARRSSPIILVGTILLLTAGTLSSLRAWNPVESILIVGRFGWITLGFFWVMRSVAADREAFGKLMGAWRAMLLINAVIAVTDQVGLTGFSVVHVEGRVTGFFEHPNEFAGLLALGLPLLLLGVGDRRRYRTDGRELLARAAATGLLLFAVFTTGSMVNTAACLAGILTVLVAGGWHYVRRPSSRSRSPFLPIAVVLTALVGVSFLINSELPVVERFTRLTSGDHYVNDSVDTRDERNEIVLSRFDDLLVVGHGFDDYQGSDPQVAEAMQTHNMFLLLLFQAGLPGLVALGTILGFALKQALRLVRHTRRTPLHRPAVALLGSFAAANLVATFQPTQYQRYYWLPVALIGTLWALRRQEVRDAAAAGG